MHYFNFLHVPASEALLGFLQEEFVRSVDLNVSSAHTRTSATRAATPRAQGDTIVDWCNSVAAFFTPTGSSCWYEISSMRMNLCRSGRWKIQYAYIYMHTCPRFSISSSTGTHHVSSNTFASYKNNHNSRWHKYNTEENDYSTCISHWVVPAPAIWKHDTFYINELSSHEVWNTPYIGWHVQEPGCTRWDSAG